MKLLFTILIALPLAALSQKAVIENDTAKYNGRNFHKGDTLTLGYGSKGNKDFAYVSIGGALTGVTDLEKGWAKSQAIIDKVYKTDGTVYVRAKLISSTANLLGGNKLFINIEAAVDNKELY